MPLKQKKNELETKLEKISSKIEREYIKKQIKGCEARISDIGLEPYKAAKEGIPKLEQDIKIFEAKLEYRNMSVKDLEQESKKLYDQAKTLRAEGKTFEAKEALRKFSVIQDILLEDTNFEAALAKKEFMDGIENMTSEQLKENIETERAEAKSILTPCKTKQDYQVVKNRAKNCLRRLQAYQSQLESIDPKVAKEAAFNREVRLKTKSLEERLINLIVSDLPEVPEGKVEVESEKEHIAELEDLG